jgi:hypothetical protein
MNIISILITGTIVTYMKHDNKNSDFKYKYFRIEFHQMQRRI